MIYAIGALCAVSVLQLGALVVLLRRRPELDLRRVESRLGHLADAIALLTDAAQSGFASVAGELEQHGRRRSTPVSRAAAAKRIVTAARKGRSLQDIAADEDVSESEVRLHLGLAEDLMPVPQTVAVDGTRRSARRRGPTLGVGA